MSDTPECVGGGIKEKEDEHHIVPFTIVSLLFYSVFFFLFFLIKPYRGYLHVILHRAPTHVGRIPRRRTLSWRPTSLVLWNNNKPRSVIDNGQPMKFEAKQPPIDVFDVNGRGWIRYIIENELQHTMGPQN